MRARLKVFLSRLWMTTPPCELHAEADPLVRLQGRGFRLGPGISGLALPYRRRVPRPGCADARHGRLELQRLLANYRIPFICVTAHTSGVALQTSAFWDFLRS